VIIASDAIITIQVDIIIIIGVKTMGVEVDATTPVCWGIRRFRRSEADLHSFIIKARHLDLIRCGQRL
jgi:hypothetical protein